MTLKYYLDVKIYLLNIGIYGNIVKFSSFIYLKQKTLSRHSALTKQDYKAHKHYVLTESKNK